MMPMWWFDGGGGWVAWLLMALSTVAFWALIVWGVVAFTRRGGEGSPRAERSPEEILAQRYAEGEIDDDEYERRLARIRGEPSRRGPA